MPLNIEGILLYSFFISEIKRLLENKGSQHGVKLLRRTAECGVKKLFDLINRDGRQDMLAKEAWPSSIRLLLGARKSQGSKMLS